MQQFHDEALEKQKCGLVEIIDWEALKALPDGQFPEALKSSPLSTVPHKSRGWRAILDLSWVLQWGGRGTVGECAVNKVGSSWSN